jgi:flagellar FliJ protein
MDDAARRLVELIASERSGQQKLEMLESYRAEYRERFVEAARAGIGPDQLRNYTAFINRIDDAIAAQHLVVEQSRNHTSQGQQVWIAQRNKVRAFDTLSQRHQKVLAQNESRQEQRSSDEHAARQHLKRNGD